MPSAKSGRVSERKRKINAPHRTRARTYVAKARAQIDGAEDAGASESNVREAVVALDKAAQRGTIHPRNAARRKSRLMKQLNGAKK